MVNSMWSWKLGLGLVTAGALVYVAGTGYAGADKKFGADIRKIADAIKSGDKSAAEDLAKKTAKKAEELGDIMHLFKLRNKGGLGIGATPLAKSDGIETRLRDIARDAPSNMSKDGPLLEQMGYDTAAISLVTKAMAPKDMGKKKSSDFKKWSDDMYETSVTLAKAAKAGGAQDVKGAAAKVNASCNSCHSIFRE
jgi:cytochrome c556